MLAIGLFATEVSAAQAELFETTADAAPVRSPTYISRPIIGGPALTRAGIVWAQSRQDGGYALMLGDANGARQLATLGSAIELQVGAEGDRIAAAHNDWYVACRGGRCPKPLADEVFTGTTDSPFTRLTGCTVGEPGCITHLQPATKIRVTDDAVAFTRSFARDVEVHNFEADASAAVRRFPGGPEFALAGRYLAVQATTDDKSTVYDRWTGEALYTVNSIGPYALDTDGTIVAALWPNGGWVWMSPSDPTPHPLTPPPPVAPAGEGSSTSVALRNSTLAWLYDITGVGSEFVFQELHGDRMLRLPTFTSRTRKSDFAFDGRQLAWSEETCGATFIARVQFDPGRFTASEFPATPTGSCALAMPSLSSHRVTESGGLMVALRCPASAQLGCQGGLNLSGRGRAYAFMGGAQVLMRRDTTRSVRIQLRHRALAALLRDRRVRADLASEGAGRASHHVRFMLLRPHTQPVRLRTIAEGSRSSVGTKPLRLVIRDRNAWAQLWDRLQAGVSPKPPRPGVNFRRYMLIAVAAGSRPNGGYSLRVDKVADDGHQLIASLIERVPGENCVLPAVVTSPYHVVRIPRTAEPVRFKHRTTVYDC